MGSVLALLSGVAVLFMTFWVTYAIIFYGAIEVSVAMVLAADFRIHVVSGIFIVLLFIGNATTCREYLADIPKGHSLRRWGGYRYVSLAATAKIFCAPGHDCWAKRLVLASEHANVCDGTIQQQDGCWSGLWTETVPCYLKKLEVSLESITSTRNCCPRGTFPGIVFLEKGLTATPELRQELGRLE